MILPGPFDPAPTPMQRRARDLARVEGLAPDECPAWLKCAANVAAALVLLVLLPVCLLIWKGIL